MKKRSSKADPQRLLIWGINPVMEFLTHVPEAIYEIMTLPSFGRKKRQKAVLNSARARGALCRQVQDFNRLDMPQSAVHQGVAALVSPVWNVKLSEISSAWTDEPPLVVVCDEITDPGNLGAIIRSAAAFGVHAVILSRRNSADVNGTVVKASAGAIVHTKVCVAGNSVKTLDALKREGLETAALTAVESTPLWDSDLSRPLALVLGAEGKGLRHVVLKNCDSRLHIPQRAEVESLNVASACTAALYETARQRRGPRA